MKILVADKISERGLALLRETGWDVVTPAAADVPTQIADADGLVVRSATKVTPALLKNAPKLRVIGRAGVGVDNVDMDAATRHGVLVMNTPGGNSVSVAEHTFALMLAVARSVPQANASIHSGKWEKSAFSGTELRGKTLGLVGLGRIGSEVARRAHAFEIKVLAYDPYVTPAAAREVDVDLVSLEELLQRSDVVSLHTALSASTEKIINGAALAQMIGDERFFDVGIIGPIRPVAQVAIPEFFMEQPDDAILRNPFGFADIAHISRILPVNSSCIMPCLIWRALSSFFSSASIAASMSERAAAMATCSCFVGGKGRRSDAYSPALIPGWPLRIELALTHAQ